LKNSIMILTLFLKS